MFKIFCYLWQTNARLSCFPSTCRVINVWEHDEYGQTFFQVLSKIYENNKLVGHTYVVCAYAILFRSFITLFQILASKWRPNFKPKRTLYVRKIQCNIEGILKLLRAKCGLICCTIFSKTRICFPLGISYLSGTPLGLELYKSSCKLMEDTTMVLEEKYRILESFYDKLKSVRLFF